MCSSLKSSEIWESEAGEGMDVVVLGSDAVG
jgi:hypothetical protein